LRVYRPKDALIAIGAPVAAATPELRVSDPITITALIIGGSHAVRPFVGKILGPSADVIGGYLADRVRGFLAENTAATLRRAEEMVIAAGVEPKAIPPRSLIPLLEYAAREDHPDLRELWAGLIANAAISGDDETVPPVYAAILSQLTPLAAVGLECLTRLESFTEGMKRHVTTSPRLPGGATVEEFRSALTEKAGWPKGRRAANNPTIANEISSSTDAVIDILARQQLASKTMLFTTEAVGGAVELRASGYDLRVTELGRRFLAACKPPRPAGGSPPA
jgi:hypothetical protein